MLSLAQYATAGTIADTTGRRAPKSRNPRSTCPQIPFTSKSRTILQHHIEPPPFAKNQMPRTQETVKVAAVQAAPVAFDLPKSLMKVAQFATEAAKAGADLVVFP